ncbi:MAG: L-erythro-3,5-diaminohexanoate dehydrogenase [Flavobacteriales bacterium]|nr:L-erythro-3,5-diaminohexanoate dehydrogenase [Flavobacteriales bacterium]
MEHRVNGNSFGTHRVISPKGVLPQPADKLDNNMSYIYDNEILVDVEILNIDSASFAQLKAEVDGDLTKLKERIIAIVDHQGKMRNPVTLSGGMFIGEVAEIGEALKDKIDLRRGDRISSLVSLSLTPLFIEEIIEIKVNVDQVFIKGKAILFENGLYAKLPKDIPPALALSVLDVAGAPAQTKRYVNKDDVVVIIGASGKSGLLCAYEAQKKVGDNGLVIGIDYSDKGISVLEESGLCNHVIKLDARNAISCFESIYGITNGDLADFVINCVNIPDTEMACIMMTKNQGKVYFFSMATSFTKAALGAEGVGKDIEMIIGNGYAEGHADVALNILRESPELRKYYESVYA